MRTSIAWPPGATGRLLKMTPPRLYYMPRTRSSRVLWLLEEIGAPYDLTEIKGAERRSEEHLLRHPLGRVPALELGDGTTMFESAAICLELADLNPGAGLIGPVGSTARGLVYQWVVFAVSELEGPLFRWFANSARGSPTPRRATASRPRPTRSSRPSPTMTGSSTIVSALPM